MSSADGYGMYTYCHICYFTSLLLFERLIVLLLPYHCRVVIALLPYHYRVVIALLPYRCLYLRIYSPLAGFNGRYYTFALISISHVHYV